MYISFRQGLISFSKIPKYITMNSSGNIDLNASSTPISMTFCEGESNYLFIESTDITDAWTIPKSTQCWLYWDISKTTANRTFGYTTYNPFQYTAPTSPSINQMYFNKSRSRFQVWNGQVWVDVIRMIAGEISAKGLVYPMGSGSQVNLLIPSEANTIVLDTNKKPIKIFRNGGYEFYTSYTIKNTKNITTDSYSYNLVSESNGLASENITKNYCVSWDNDGNLKLATPDDEYQAIAITENDVSNGSTVALYTQGYVTNRYDWNWKEPPHTRLYLGNNGELSTGFDITTNIQCVGYIITPNTIYLDFKPKIIVKDRIPI